MSPRTIVGLVLLLLVSLAIGWYAGSWGYSIFEKTVPAGAVTGLVRSGTRGAYATAGILLGLLVFAWTTLVAWLARILRGPTAQGGSTPPAK